MRCCICDQPIEVVLGWAEGHNAQPVENGRCCGPCNDTFVIPARIAEMLKEIDCRSDAEREEEVLE